MTLRGKPEDFSLEHMSVQESIADLEKLTWKRKLRSRYLHLRYATKTQINLWILAREAKYENPKGGADEVSRLRKKLVIERRFLEKVG
jgi:L-ribulose-5-phosphate 3-epimerase UlaE